MTSSSVEPPHNEKILLLTPTNLGEDYQRSASKLRKRSKIFFVGRIDCDVYESAIGVLNFCFQMSVISNGLRLLFDYCNCNDLDLHYGERRAWRGAVTAYKIIFLDEGCYRICGHKFIVHSYSLRE